MDRPKADETEEDILALQRKFLAKRKLNEEQRDIVTLNTEGKPQVKKSKYKKERVKFKDVDEEAMDVGGDLSGSVMVDVHERQRHGPPVTMTTLHTKHGFPIVRMLDLSKPNAAAPGGTGTGQGGSRFKKKKSLFLNQFENKELDYFGIEVTSGADGSLKERSSHKDVVEPIPLGVGIQNQDKGTGQEAQEDNGNAKEEEEEETTPALLGNWLKSSLVIQEEGRGEGVTTGASLKEEIHQENVRLLAGLSEQEILEKKQQLEQALKPELASFLRSRHKKKTAATLQAAGTNEGEESSSSSGRGHEVPTKGWEGPDRVQPPHGWVHMNVVEKEKMEWMTDVSRPLSCPTLDKVDARFSLDGIIIPRGSDLPHHLGLHHHGDEPEAAGYTLSELLPLCRSSVLQQRVLSLHTLAQILRKAWQHDYVGKVEGFVVDRLVQAQLPLLLRLCLDESVEAGVKAALTTLHALLVVPAEELLVEEFSLCYSGSFLPSLQPVLQNSKPPDKREGKTAEEEEEKEMDILQKDIIAGYLQMSLLPRVRYILEVMLPQDVQSVHVPLLEVLTRVARHSLSAATQVADCPHLLNVVFERHLPLSWQDPIPNGDQTLPRPLLAAVKLVRTLCCAGRNLAKRLVSDYKLSSILVRYAVPLPVEQNLRSEEAFWLATASLGVWQVLLYYGLCDEALSDVFPVFLKQLQKLAFLSENDVTLLEARRTCALLGLVEAVMTLAATSPEELRLGVTESLPPPSLVWGHASGMATPLLHALAAWTKENTSLGKGALDRMLVLAALLHSLATYYNKLQHQAGKSPGPLEVLEQVERLVATVLTEILMSSLFTSALQVLRDGVNLPKLLSHRVSALPSCFLPSYLAQTIHHSSLQGDGAVLRSLNLVLGYLRLALACISLHTGVLQQTCMTLFTYTAFNQVLDAYLHGRAEVDLQGQLRSQIIHCCVEIFVLWAVAFPVDEDLIKKVQALSFLQSSYSPVVFHSAFYRNSESVKDKFKAIFEQNLPKRGGNASATTLPVDWVLLPLMEEYTRTQTLEKHTLDTSCVEVSLRFLLHLERHNPMVFCKLNPAARLASVMCVFLMDCALFLEAPYNTLLGELLQIYCSLSQTMDLTSRIPGFLSFSDLYRSFVEHFAAVSYGDNLFASYILLPLQQRFPVELRKLLWGDYVHAVSYITVPPQDFMMEVKEFMCPPETDATMIELYRAALGTGRIRKTTNNLVYSIVNHHVHGSLQQ